MKKILSWLMVLTMSVLMVVPFSVKADNYIIETDINQEYVSELGINLLSGITPVIKDGAGSSKVGIEGNDLNRLTDGSVFEEKHIGIYSSTGAAGSGTIITYDLGTARVFNNFLVVGYYTNGCDYCLGKYELYVSDTLSDLYSQDNKVLSYNNTGEWQAWNKYKGGGQSFLFNKKLSAQYFGIKIVIPNITDDCIRLDEIGLYCSDNYSVQNTGICESTLSELGDNLLAGKPSYLKDGNGNTPYLDGGTAANLTDGQILRNTHIGIYGYPDITVAFDMQAQVVVDKILVAGFYSSSYDYGTKEYELYLSTSPEDLFEPINRVVHYVNDEALWNPSVVGSGCAQIFSFENKFSGKYIGLKIKDPNPTDNDVRLDEIGVYGTSEVTIRNYGIGQTDVTALGNNMLCGITPVITDGNGDEPIWIEGNDLGRLTDGLIYKEQHIGIYSGTQGAAANTTITYDMGRIVKCSNILVSGYYFGSTNYCIGSYELYLSNTPEDMYAPENMIASYDNTGVWQENSVTRIGGSQIFDINKYATGRYFSIKIIQPNFTDDCIRLDELGVYSAQNVISVDTENIINDDYLGLGVNIIPTNLMTASTVQGYSNADWEMDKKRIRQLKLPFARVWFQIDWMEQQKGIYTWNSVKMQAFYKYLDLLLETDTEVEINFGMKIGTEIQGWFSMPDSDPATSAPADLNAYANSCSALVDQLINVKGYTNVKYLSFYNEPNGSDFSGPADKKAYYAEMVRRIDAKLRTDNLRSLIKIWGPEDNSEDASWTAYMEQNAGNCFDGYSYHDYTSNYNTINSSIGNRIEAANGKSVYMTEFGLEGEISGWNYSYAGNVISGSKSGLNGTAVWLLNGGYLEDPYFSSGFNGGYNLWDSVNTTQNPRKNYYEFGMLTRYIPSHSQVIKTETLSSGIRATAFLTPDGEYTVVVESNGGNSNNLKITFDKDINKTFKRHVYTQDTAPEANAIIPSEDAIFEVKRELTDSNVDRNYSVMVYTTIDSQTQVAVTPAFSKVGADMSIQLSADILDGTANDVVWSVVSGNGTIDQNGVFTSSGGNVGEKAAVKAVSVSDPNVWGIAVLSITESAVSSSLYQFFDNRIVNVSPQTSQTEFLDNIKFSEKAYGSLYGLTSDNNVKSGSLLKVTNKKANTETYTIIVIGDINCDSKCSVLDLVRLKKELINCNSEELFLYCGDLDRNGSVNSNDICILRKQLLMCGG